MTDARAQQYGVSTRFDSVFLLRGRGLLWSFQYHGNGNGTLFDNLSPGEFSIAQFFTDPTNTKATGTFLHWPQGFPFFTGLYLTGGATCTFTYTGLSEIFFTV